MHRICAAIWETGEWTEEWTFSTFIPIPKKGDLKQCENYRTIALVSHASKILLCIILERIQVKTKTSGYATWFTAGAAIRIAHYDVNDDVITRKL